MALSVSAIRRVGNNTYLPVASGKFNPLIFAKHLEILAQRAQGK